MATVDQCEEAIIALAERVSGVDEGTRAKHSLDRVLTCKIPDLGVTFSGIVKDGLLHDLVREDRKDAQIKLTVGSGDLLDLLAGHLGMPLALATGRLKLDASVKDLLRLRSYL